MGVRMAYDRILILAVLTLVGFGLAMVFSASFVVSKELYGSSTAILLRQLLAVGIGILLMLILMTVNYRIYEKPVVLWTLLALTVSLLALALLAPGANGARRWIDLGPMNFQPSEMAKLVAIMFTARFIVKRGGRVETVDRSMLPYAVVMGLIACLILLEPDLGTAASLAITASLLFFLAGLRFRYYLGLLLLAIPAFYVLVYRVPYRRDRILAFLDASADPYGVGYQIRQSLIAVGSGGWTGMGFAEGSQKLFFLPELHTDFIYALVGQELGFLGAIIPICLFFVFFWRGVRIGLRADSQFGMFLGLGIVGMIVTQAFLNMSVVLSLLPTKGLPLPFISAGGSSMLMMFSSVGILLNIGKQARWQTGTKKAHQKRHRAGRFEPIQIP